MVEVLDKPANCCQGGSASRGREAGYRGHNMKRIPFTREPCSAAESTCDFVVLVASSPHIGHAARG